MSTALAPTAAVAAPSDAASVSPSPSVALAAFSLAKRELVRFFRQRTRVVGALVQPVLFWVVLGAGMDNPRSPRPGMPRTPG